MKILNSTMAYLAILFISSNQDSMDLKQDIKTTFCQPICIKNKLINGNVQATPQPTTS